MCIILDLLWPFPTVIPGYDIKMQLSSSLAMCCKLLFIFMVYGEGGSVLKFHVGSGVMLFMCLTLYYPRESFLQKIEKAAAISEFTSASTLIL